MDISTYRKVFRSPFKSAQCLQFLPMLYLHAAPQPMHRIVLLFHFYFGVYRHLDRIARRYPSSKLAQRPSDVLSIFIYRSFFLCPKARNSTTARIASSVNTFYP